MRELYVIINLFLNIGKRKKMSFPLYLCVIYIYSEKTNIFIDHEKIVFEESREKIFKMIFKNSFPSH